MFTGVFTIQVTCLALSQKTATNSSIFFATETSQRPCSQANLCAELISGFTHPTIRFELSAENEIHSFFNDCICRCDCGHPAQSMMMLLFIIKKNTIKSYYKMYLI